eukprot:RCo023623
MTSADPLPGGGLLPQANESPPPLPDSTDGGSGSSTSIAARLGRLKAVPQVGLFSAAQAPFAGIHYVSQTVVATTTQAGQEVVQWLTTHAAEAASAVPEEG